MRHRIDEAQVLETAPLRDGRVLLLLADPEEEETDLIHVVLGGLDRLDGR